MKNTHKPYIQHNNKIQIFCDSFSLKSLKSENIPRLWMLPDSPCLNDGVWTPSRGAMPGWVLCMDPSYLLPSYNSLWWAAQSLTRPRLLSVCHWRDLIRAEAARIPPGWKIEIWGAETETGESDLWRVTGTQPSRVTLCPRPEQDLSVH